MSVGYVEDLRAAVGKRPLILTSAMVVMLDTAGRVLLQRNADTGAWHVPGGYMEPGESLEETAKREAKEECDVVVHDLRLFGVFSGRDLFWTYPNGDQVYNVTVAYVAGRWEGVPRADGREGSEVAFFELRGLPERLGPPATIVLARLRAHLEAAAGA